MALAGCLQDGDADDPTLPPPAAPASACDDATPPGAPTGLRSVPGPGPGMNTVLWDPVDADPPVVSYTILRDGEPFPLGNTLAFGDHGAGTYAVLAVDACGNVSDPSASVQGTALPGGELLEAPTAPLSTAQTDEVLAYPAYDPVHNVTGEAAWRIVEGTGNCCENYVITTQTGRIVDFGGTFLHFSDDEGVTWETVQTPIPYLTGEGAVVTGPQGDILAVGWSPYTGDQLWSHKYVAADDQWYYQTMPLHQPFYDRAWTSVVKGPFTIDGVVTPYIVLVESNFHGGLATVLLRSLDGLHYAEPTDSALVVDPEVSLAVGGLPRDPDMDWIHPISQAPVRPLAHGLGLQQRSSGLGDGCHWRLILQNGMHACPTGDLADLPRNQPLYADSEGNMHHFLQDGPTITYRMRAAGTEAWTETSYEIPDGWTAIRERDEAVNAQLDTAVVALHLGADNGTTGDYLLRFRNITTAPWLETVYQVGLADSGSDAGLGGERRFDFMTVGMLPDGRAVMSFTDSEHHPPALAIEE